MKEYEHSNIDLSKYRPFLWGSAAASHYSVKDDPNCALWNQPKTSQILDLFVPEMVNNTITKFPVQRTLKVYNLFIVKIDDRVEFQLSRLIRSQI